MWIKTIVAENEEIFHPGLIARLKNPVLKTSISIDELQVFVKTPNLNFKLRLILLLYQLKLSDQHSKDRELVLRRMRLFTHQSLYFSLAQLLIAQWENNKDAETVFSEKIFSAMDLEKNVEFYAFLPRESLKEKFQAHLQTIPDKEIIDFTFADIYSIKKNYPDFISSENWDILIKKITHENYEHLRPHEALDLVSHFRRLTVPILANTRMYYTSRDLFSLLDPEYAFSLIKNIYETMCIQIVDNWPLTEKMIEEKGIDSDLLLIRYFLDVHATRISKENVREIQGWLFELACTNHPDLVGWVVGFFEQITNRIEPQERYELIEKYAAHQLQFEKYNHDKYIRYIKLLDDDERLQQEIYRVGLDFFELKECFHRLNVTQQKKFLNNWMPHCMSADFNPAITTELLEYLLTESSQSKNRIWNDKMIWVAIKCAKPLSSQQIEGFIACIIEGKESIYNWPSLDDLRIWFSQHSVDEIEQLRNKVFILIDEAQKAQKKRKPNLNLQKIYLQLSNIQTERLSQHSVLSQAIDAVQQQADNCWRSRLGVLQPYLPRMNEKQKENFMRYAITRLLKSYDQETTTQALLQVNDPVLCHQFFSDVYKINSDDSKLMNFRFLICNAWYPYVDEEKMLSLVELNSEELCHVEPQSIQERFAFNH